MNGRCIASLARQVKKMDELGYAPHEIAHVMNLVHFCRDLCDDPVCAPHVAVGEDGKLYADGHLLTTDV